MSETIWRLVQDTATGIWVGACDELKLTAQGPTLGDVKRRIDEILRAQSECEEDDDE